MSPNGELAVIERRYARARRLEHFLGVRRDLANDAFVVVLEWGPALRLPEEWRLAHRQPDQSAEIREQALRTAKDVLHEAYELVAPAWPQDRREDARVVDEQSAVARQSLEESHPQLSPKLLRRAVNQANYTHAK
jgi:hypothetical protein